MQMASILGENHVKLVPEIAVTGEGGGGLVNAMIAKMLSNGAVNGTGGVGTK